MQEEVRAKRFVVVDENGEDCAILGMQDNTVALTLKSPGGDSSQITIQIDAAGNAQLKLVQNEKCAELQVTEHRASLRMANEGTEPATCSMAVDCVGAWVVTESTPGVGTHMHSRNDGAMTAIWLSEHQVKHSEKLLCSRYLRPEPSDDKVSGWIRNP